MRVFTAPRRLAATREGKWFLALTLGVGIAAVNTGNNLLFIVLSANLSIVVVSGILSEMTLRGVRASVSQPSEAFAGRDALFAVSCRPPAGRRFPALSIDVSFRVGDGPRLTARMPDIPPGGEGVRVLTFRPARRGVESIRDLKAATRFPFALFEKSLEPAAPAPVTIFPAPGPRRDEARPGAFSAEPDARPDGRGAGAGIFGIRDYVPGDPARDIHWKATARFGRRMVREREGERGGVLDIRLPDDDAGPAFERAISRACGDVLACDRAGTGFRILRGGEVVVDGSFRGKRREALTWLATATPLPPRSANADERPPEASEAAVPAPEPGGVLRLLPRLFWGSGILLLPSAGLPVGAVLAAGAAFAAGLWLESRHATTPGGRRGEPLLAAAVAVAAAASWFAGGRDLLRAIGLLALGIQSIRFLYPKRARECWQLSAIAFMEYLAAAATESGPRFALVAATFLLLGPGAMWSHHVLRRTEEGTPAAPVPPRFAALMLLGVAASGIVLSTLLFAVTPRLRIGHLSRKQPAGRHSIGFADSITPGDIAGAAADRRVAARIDFPDGAPRGDRYLKGGTWSTFDGTRWRKDGETPAIVPRGGIAYYLAPARQGAPPTEAEVTLEPLDSAAFFVYGSPLTAEGPLGELRIDRAGNLSLPTSDRPTIRYRLRYQPGPVPPSRMFPGPRAEDLAMPSGDWGALAAMAAEAAPHGPPDAERARRLVAFLGSGYRYTLDGPTGDLRDFLFVRKAGYCEHFASALCLMLRSAGIPARVAAGFMGGEWNDVGGYLIVRQSDAHAWTEGWIGGRWVTLDATPGTSAPAARSMAGGTGEKYLDWLKHGWDRYVVDYDLATQARGVEAIGRAIGKVSGGGRSARGLASTAFRTAAAAVLLAFAAAWLRRRLRRKSDARLPDESPLPPPYRRLFAALERNGYRATEGDTPAGMLAKAVASRPELAADAARFAALYHRDRFGAAPLPAAARAEAFGLAARLRTALPPAASRGGAA
jgi:transglutaminase-like putative cysteine protease/uncharacterized protein (DUF58 family)